MDEDIFKVICIGISLLALILIGFWSYHNCTTWRYEQVLKMDNNTQQILLQKYINCTYINNKLTIEGSTHNILCEDNTYGFITYCQ